MTDDIVAGLREYGMNAPTGFRVYHDAANEIERLRAELAAEREQLRLTNIDWFTAEAERDALRELLREARPYVSHHGSERTNAFLDSIDAALKGDGDE